MHKEAIHVGKFRVSGTLSGATPEIREVLDNLVKLRRFSDDFRYRPDDIPAICEVLPECAPGYIRELPYLFRVAAEMPRPPIVSFFAPIRCIWMRAHKDRQKMFLDIEGKRYSFEFQKEPFWN